MSNSINSTKHQNLAHPVHKPENEIINCSANRHTKEKIKRNFYSKNSTKLDQKTGKENKKKERNIGIRLEEEEPSS